MSVCSYALVCVSVHICMYIPADRNYQFVTLTSNLLGSGQAAASLQIMQDKSGSPFPLQIS